VNHARTLHDTSRYVLGDRLTDWFIRQSFFSVFCSGRNREETMQMLQELEKRGVGGILDYAAEADVDESQKRDDVGMTDRARDQTSALTYDYAGEALCDEHAAISLEAIRAAGPGGFAAVKMTSLGNPELLQRMSTVINEVRSCTH